MSPQLRTLVQRLLLVLLALTASTVASRGMLWAWQAEAEAHRARGAAAADQLLQLQLADWRSCAVRLPTHLQVEGCGPAPR